MLPDFDKWPVVLQLMAYVGAAVAGAVVLLRGAKSKPEQNSPVDLELKAIRADFEIALEALKVSVHNEFGRLQRTVESVRALIEAYEKRLREAETTIAVLEDRGDRRKR